MKITRIQVYNFRSIRDADLMDLNNSVAIFGLNGQAKSSVLAAVRMALYGWCEFTTRGGVGAQALIRDGAKAAEVDVYLTCDSHPSPLCVTLVINRRASNEWSVINMDTGEILDMRRGRQTLWELAGIDPAHAEVAGMPAAYVGSKDLDDILADFLAGGVSEATVLEAAGEHAGWLKEYATSKRLSLTTPDDWRNVGKRAYDERTEINRELKEAQLENDLLKGARAPRDSQGRQLEVADLGRIENAVIRDEEQIQLLHIELGKAQAAPDPAAVEAERADTEQNLWAEQAKLKAAQAEIIIARAALENAQVEASDVRQKMADIERSCADATHQAEMAKRSLSTLQAEDGACPTCRRPYTAKNRKELLAPLEAVVKEHEAAAIKIHEDKKKLLDSLPALDESAKKERLAVEALESQIRYADRDIATHEAALKTLQAPTDHRPTGTIQADIDSLRDKVERGKGLVDALKKLKEAQAAEMRLHRYEAMKEPLEWAVQAFKDGELVKGLISDQIGAFVKACNTELQQFGYSVDVEVQGKRVELLLQCPCEEYRPVRLCSDGQKMLVQFAVASAFAAVGAPILLDNLNELDNVNRKQVLARLRERAETGTVIIAAAWQQSNSDMDRIANALAPITVVWAEQGKLTVRGDHAATEVVV